MSFIPIVLGNGRIYLEVAPSVSSLDAASGVTLAGSSNVPGRSINSVHTTVELEAGQTFVIGGLIQHYGAGHRQQGAVPGRSALVGRVLPQHQSYQDTEQEVLVIVTPWLVDADVVQSAAENRFREKKRADPMILSYSWKESSRRRADRARFARIITMCRAWMNSPSATLFPCASNGVTVARVAVVWAAVALGGCAVPAGSEVPAGPASMAPANATPAPGAGMPAPLPAPRRRRPPLVPASIATTQAAGRKLPAMPAPRPKAENVVAGRRE